MPELALHALRSERRALLGWALATIALVGAVLAFWPSIRGNEALTQSFADLPPSVRAATGLSDLGSPAGYLQGQLFATLAPLIFLSFAIGRGARAIAGEEEARTMDLLLATPLRRARVVVEKAAAVAAQLLGLALVTWLTLLAVGPLVDLGLPAGRLAGATVGGMALGLLYGGLALLLSAATGRRGLSLGIAAGLAGAGFLYTSIAPFVGGLSDHLGLSPFQLAYGYDPLKNGIDWGDLAVLVVGALILTALSALAFDRRDVR